LPQIVLFYQRGGGWRLPAFLAIRQLWRRRKAVFRQNQAYVMFCQNK